MCEGGAGVCCAEGEGGFVAVEVCEVGGELLERRFDFFASAIQSTFKFKIRRKEKGVSSARAGSIREAEGEETHRSARSARASASRSARASSAAIAALTASASASAPSPPLPVSAAPPAAPPPAGASRDGCDWADADLREWRTRSARAARFCSRERERRRESASARAEARSLASWAGAAAWAWAWACACVPTLSPAVVSASLFVDGCCWGDRGLIEASSGLVGGERESVGMLVGGGGGELLWEGKGGLLRIEVGEGRCAR